MESVTPDIMQSFNKLSEQSLKFAVESIKEFSNNVNESSIATTTSTATTTTTTNERNQLLPIIENAIWDESYNWLKQTSAGESLSKFLNCKSNDELPQILKERKSINSVLESLTIDQTKDIFIHLSLENLDSKDFNKLDMILKIEEEMMMQGIFKLLFRLNKKAIESFSQDLKIKFNSDNLSSVCDQIMSTMYDLEESPDSIQLQQQQQQQSVVSPPLDSTVTVSQNNNNNNVATTSPPLTATTTTTVTTNSPPTNTTDKKETPTKSKKGTPMKAPTKKQPGTPNGTISASPSKNSTNTNTVQSPTAPSSSSSGVAESTTPTSNTTANSKTTSSTTTTTTTTTNGTKKKVRSSLDKPSSDLPLTPTLPGKRERKPVPIDPLLQTSLNKSPPVEKSTTTTNGTKKTTTKASTAATAIEKPKPARVKRVPANKTNKNKRKREEEEEEEQEEENVDKSSDEEEEQENNIDNQFNSYDENEDYVDDEEFLNISNRNHNNQPNYISYQNGEPRGYYEDEGKKKWVCPSLDYIKKGVERAYLQNEFNLSDLIEYCKLHNLPKNKTKSKTIRIIMDFIYNGIVPSQPNKKQKKKPPVKKGTSKTTDNNNEVEMTA